MCLGKARTGERNPAQFEALTADHWLPEVNSGLQDT